MGRDGDHGAVLGVGVSGRRVKGNRRWLRTDAGASSELAAPCVAPRGRCPVTGELSGVRAPRRATPRRRRDGARTVRATAGRPTPALARRGPAPGPLAAPAAGPRREPAPR